jgi:hypothetical protein
MIGPLGVSKSVYSFGSTLGKLDTGFIPHYALYIILGTCIIIAYNIIRII